MTRRDVAIEIAKKSEHPSVKAALDSLVTLVELAHRDELNKHFRRKPDPPHMIRTLEKMRKLLQDRERGV